MLVFCGLFVIGLVDNLLRPILVGKNTKKLPDFTVVLIATGRGAQAVRHFGLHHRPDHRGAVRLSVGARSPTCAGRMPRLSDSRPAAVSGLHIPTDKLPHLRANMS